MDDTQKAYLNELSTQIERLPRQLQSMRDNVNEHMAEIADAIYDMSIELDRISRALRALRGKE